MKSSLNSRGDLKIIPLLLSGGAIFSMHFGASSMVWPMTWGKESGSSVWLAFLGVFITALLLVIVGYIALARGNGSYGQLLSRAAGSKFGNIFSFITVAVLGPLYVIPRMSAAAWDSVRQAFNLPSDKIYLIIFTVVFYIVAFVFMVSPGKVMDRISKILFPVLITMVILVVGKSLLFPIGTAAAKSYSQNPVAYGFTSGYATGEIVCALLFGAVIISSLKDKGVSESRMTSNMIRAGILGVSILALTHLSHMIIGSQAASVFPDLNYTALYTAVATMQYGDIGGRIFAVALTLAAMASGIGITSGCADFFVEFSDSKISYKVCLLVILGLSTILGCLGLTDILAYLGPILDGIYPPIIVLVLYYALVKNSDNPRLKNAAKWAIYVSTFFGALDAIWKYLVKFNIGQSVCDVYLKLPLADVSLAWVPWTVAAFLLVLLIGPGKKQQAQA